jgi:hypothetical protein
MKLLKDLFFEANNASLDWGRLVGILVVGSVLAAAWGNYHHGQAIDLGPTGLPGGLATILAAASYYILKDRQQAGKHDG